MAKRVESPSSINTFKQCPRKYYYNYVEKLPRVANIHQIRGNIAHSTLENFYDIDVSQFNEENYSLKFKEVIQQLLMHQWNTDYPRLHELNLSKDKLKFYFEETMLMLMNWVNHFITDFEKVKINGTSIQEAFIKITPIREQEYRSDNYSVRGFIDAIQHIEEEEVHIIDYKTNARFDMKDAIRLQLAIYSLLYQEKHGVLPSKVGIFFLRHKLKMMNVDEELLELAKREIELIHMHTSATEEKEDYKRKITGLCKWRTGQCDFYETCKPHD